jgi:hypothetical protein
MRRPSYLLRGPTGLYYVRVRVPLALRQQRPDLPSEVRVTTRVRNRRAAARITRAAAPEAGLAGFRGKRCAASAPSFAPECDCCLLNSKLMVVS